MAIISWGIRPGPNWPARERPLRSIVKKGRADKVLDLARNNLWRCPRRLPMRRGFCSHAGFQPIAHFC
jgi:hypothetical protein